MAKRIELSRSNNVNLEYNGNRIRFTIPRWNAYNFCFTSDISVNDETAYGVTLRSGIDVVRQFNFPFNLYVINADDIPLDAITFSALRLYILEQGDLEAMAGSTS